MQLPINTRLHIKINTTDIERILLISLLLLPVGGLLFLPNHFNRWHYAYILNWWTNIPLNAVWLDGRESGNAASCVQRLDDVMSPCTLVCKCVRSSSSISGASLTPGTLNIDETATQQTTITEQTKMTMPCNMNIHHYSSISGASLMPGTLNIDETATQQTTMTMPCNMNIHHYSSISGTSLTSGTLNIDETATQQTTMTMPCNTNIHHYC